MSRFSLDRRDRKLFGVAARLGDVFAIDPTIIRIGFVALALLGSWKVALAGYAAAALWLHIKRKQAARPEDRRSDYERMADAGTRRRPSTNMMRTELDPIDRRMMAIDDHLAKPNEELAREIEALREEK